jgi:hypothetical protein
MTSPNTFFPSSQTTPDHASASAMLAARKQQLAHLQTLQRQQQQVLQQLSARDASTPSAMLALMNGYADGRDDRFSAGGLRSNPGSPGGNVSVVSFNSTYQRVASPRRTAFECDYDTNPSELYLAVQRKDWDGALERVATCPQEASTWVSRKEADGKLRWRLLPLHAAIIFRAPEDTISALLFAFAQGAACKDDQGMLPLHLAIRNGCDENVVNLLLMAYPQSIEIQDRKGRTPMVLAQQSTHANRDLFIRALEKGSAFYVEANAVKDVENAGIMVPAMPDAYPSVLNSLPMLGGNGRVTDLEAELAKTQETSQVLVDHVNALEAQLASRSDTERFLATKIANLDAQVKALNEKLEEAEAEMEAKKEELEKKDEEAEELAEKFKAEIEELNVALADKKAAELRSYKLTNKERYELEERAETSEKELAAAQAHADALEEQLKTTIETEQSLASQVSLLASQLASSAGNSSDAASAFQRKCEVLVTENKKLQSQIEDLEGKLTTVATALDAMATEQERIVNAATMHEETMAECAKVHQTIIADTARQENMLEDAAKEREQIVSILMRQAEDAERTMADREKVLEAVKAQESQFIKAEKERDAVVASVTKQREYMDFMLNGELKFLKRTASEQERELVNEMNAMDMEEKKRQFLNKDDEEETEEAEEAEGHIGDVDEEDAEEDDEDDEAIDAAISAASSADSESA